MSISKVDGVNVIRISSRLTENLVVAKIAFEFLIFRYWFWWEGTLDGIEKFRGDLFRGFEISERRT